MKIGIVGPGRAGLALGRALAVAGHTVRVHGRREHEVPPPLVYSAGQEPPWIAEVDVVILAVPDGAVAEVATRLPGIGRDHVVLHLAGPLGPEVLASLRDTGAALGAWHPLLTMRGVGTPPDAFRGAVAAIDGDARALETGRGLAGDLAMVPVVVRGADRVRYHAGAVFAANYLVALAAAAERLMTEAGLPTDAARAGIQRLMDATLANVRVAGPAALTGPIARGDVETVQRHLEALPPEAAGLYRALGRATLALATDLSPETRQRFRDLFG